VLGVVVNNKGKKLNFRAHKAVILATGGSAGNVTSAMLGKAVIPDLPYQQPDGSPIRIDNDYSGDCADKEVDPKWKQDDCAYGRQDGLELRVG